MKTTICKTLILFLIFSCNPKKQESKSETINIEQKQKNDTLFENSNYLITGISKSKNYSFKIIKEKDFDDSSKNYESIIPFKDEVILGKNITYNDINCFRKFKPTKTFSDYYVNIFSGKLKPPNFSTNKDAYSFRTRIKEECKNGINFAGKYTLVSWGCGCPCQSNIIVDRTTGKIFNFDGTSHGSSFKKDSKLIILDYYAVDTSTNLIKLTATSNVSLGVWDKEKLKIIE